jgi:FkbM family methyltransferase
MTGATGNIYCGLQEFEDMAFTLHFLRPGDLFVDIGANIGSYTVLASAAVGAATMAFEPIPATFQSLLDNVQLNRMADRVEAFNSAVGRKMGEIEMTADRGPTNQAIQAGENYFGQTTKVPVVTLDEALNGRPVPKLIKIDVEGFESEVIAGGQAVLSDPAQQAVIMELNGSATRYGIDELALHRQMLEFNYMPYAYDPTTRLLIDLVGQKSNSGNTLYLKQPREAQECLIRSAPYKIIESIV